MSNMPESDAYVVNKKELLLLGDGLDGREYHIP